MTPFTLRPAAVIALLALLVPLVVAPPADAQTTGVIATVASGEQYSDPSVAVDSAGRPVVAYTVGGTEVRVARCDDATCSSATINALGEGTEPSLQLDGDIPVVSARLSTGSVVVYRCSDAVCSGAFPVLVGSNTNAGRPSPLQLDADGNLVVAYKQRGVEDEVRLASCDSPICLFGASDSLVAGTGDTALRDVQFELADGDDPVITYLDGDGQQLVLCRALSCPLLTRTTRSLGFSDPAALALAPDDTPLVVRASADTLRLATCDDAAFCATTTTSTLDTSPDSSVARYPDTATGADGSLVSVWWPIADNIAEVRVVTCATTACSSPTSTTIAEIGGIDVTPSVTVTGDGRPVVAFNGVVDGTFTLEVAVCGEATCSDLAVDAGGAGGGTDVDAICPTAPANPFTDVADTGVFRPAIACLADQGIVNGLTLTTFGPGDPVTRGQAAALVARTIRAVPSGLPAGTDAFEDVTGGFAVDINALAAAEIVGGISEATFSPGQPLTRGQSAAILLAAYQYVTAASLPQDPPDAFSDDDGGIFELSNNLAAAIGLVEGFDGGTFRPAETVTRGQFTQLLANLLILGRG